MALKVGELYAQLTMDDKKFNKGISGAESRFGKFAKNIGGITAGMVAGMGTVMAGAVTAVGGFGTKFNATMEQSALAWETIIGSAEEAKKVMEELQKQGAETPFEFEGLDKASKLLYMAKFQGDDLYSALTNVGDAVSAVGGNQDVLEGVSMALFQMQAKGKVQAEEMLQLAERGLPVWDILADKMNKSTGELMDMATNGELLAKDTVPMLVEGLGDRFGGAMEKQSKSFNGLISTMKDNLKMIAGELSKPFFEMAKRVLPVVTDRLSEFLDMLKSGKSLGDIIKQMIPPEIKDIVTNLADTFKERFGMIKETIGTVIENLKTVFNELVGIFISAQPTIMALLNISREVFFGVWTVIQEAINLIMPFVQETLGMIRQFWEENGTQIAQAVTNAFNIIKNIIMFVMPLIKLIIGVVWSNIRGIITGALKIIMGAIKIFAGIFTGDFSKMWEGVKQLFVGAVQFLWNLINLLMIGRILGGIKALGIKFVGFIKNMWKKSVEIFKTLDKHVHRIVGNLVSKVIGFVKNLFNGAVRNFQMLRTFGASIFNAIYQTIRSIISKLFQSVTGTIGNLRSRIVNTFGRILNSAKSKFNAIKKAIQNPIKTAKETVKGAINSIKGFFKNMATKIPMPHFNISGSMNPVNWFSNPPKLNVDWYKSGGIVDGAQLIGAGEAGPELITPLNGPRMKPFAYEIGKQMAGMMGGIQPGSNGGGSITIQIGDREIVKATSETFDRDFERKRTYKRRANGKGN